MDATGVDEVEVSFSPSATALTAPHRCDHKVVDRALVIYRSEVLERPSRRRSGTTPPAARQQANSAPSQTLSSLDTRRISSSCPLPGPRHAGVCTCRSSRRGLPHGFSGPEPRKARNLRPTSASRRHRTVGTRPASLRFVAHPSVTPRIGTTGLRGPRARRPIRGYRPSRPNSQELSMMRLVSPWQGPRRVHAATEAAEQATVQRTVHKIHRLTRSPVA